MRARIVCALGVGVALVATACSDSPTPARSGTATTAEARVDGGTVVIRLAGEPGCFDWMAPCSAGFTGVPLRNLLLPQTMAYVDRRLVPTAVVAGAPVMDIGPPQRVTYRLSPRAVWSDGVPITSSDFKYTWDQFVNAPGVRSRTAFEQIQSFDDADPKTVVITFKQPVAAWYEPFGTAQGIYPRHLLEGKDRTALMKDGFTWSGTAWKLDRWTRAEEIRFVPNPNYWGDKPHLDALVFRLIPDDAAALAAYKTGQVALLQAVPPAITLAELQALPDTTVEVTEDLAVYGLTLNTTRPPLDTAVVRQALAYATDRDTLVTQTSAQLKPDLKPIQAIMTPTNGRWYIEPFAKYRRDLGRVDQLMRGAGWARGSDGIWAKGQQRAEIDALGTSGIKAIELQEQILQSQWKEAGFEMKINNVANPRDMALRGSFHVVFTRINYENDDPSRCSLLCSRNIPTEVNGLTGQNASRIADAALDAAWERVGNELDEAKRMQALINAYQITAELVPFLPAAAGISLLVYNSARLRGVHNDGGGLGPYFDAAVWHCRGGSC